MWLFDRRKILAALSLLVMLGSCGFTPIYSEGSAASGLQGKIEITAGKGREFFEMRERLVEHFGFASSSDYTLTFTYNVVSEGLAAPRSTEITRFNLSGISDFYIVDNASGKNVFSGRVKSSTAYGATSKTYPTRLAKQDANSRLALALADQIAIRILATVGQWST